MQLQRKHIDSTARTSTIHRFVSALGSSIGGTKGTMLVENAREANVIRPRPEKLSDLFNSMSHHETFLHVPSLSLMRSSEDHHTHPLSTKQDAEEHAASNLSRPIVIFRNNCQQIPFPSTKTCVETDVTQIFCEHPFQAPCSIDDVPNQMLENLKESFGVLVDARLREYIKILARHALSLAECPGLSKHEQEEGILTVKRKIRLLVEFGSRMEVHYMCTSFQAVGNDIVLTMTMEVLVPSLRPLPSKCSIVAKTSGKITATLLGDEHISSVNVNLDGHELLSHLVEGAAEVMSMTLNNVKAFMAISLQLHDAASRKEPHQDLHRMIMPRRTSRSQVTLPIVSPDLGSFKIASSASCVSTFVLDDKDGDLHLSPEKCESIIDSVIGHVDNSLISHNSKKRMFED